MLDAQPDPLLLRALPLAEELIRQDHFSIENLCHALDCGLKDLAVAVGSVDEVVAHVNDRFMAAYIAKARQIDAATNDHRQALQLLSAAWYDHALANPNAVRMLLQRRWSAGYVRPDWYMARVNGCFLPLEGRLRQLAPQATPGRIAGVARGLYAFVCGLYFLAANERATPAGIADQHKLLGLTVDTLITGLVAHQG